jgi:hypothetical protein
LENLQNRVNSLLKWGIVFSIIWLAGIGSIIAFISGIKARKLIKEADDKLSGTVRVWWCLIVGALGVLFWVPIIVIGILNQF